MITGSFTALITPFAGESVDYEGLGRLVEFQLAGNMNGVLAVGTTGESPSLDWDEHNRVTGKIAQKLQGSGLCIAGTGSNNTKESLSATKHAAEAGADAVLLVDPYYNGPSSLEIRREYIEPIAASFPNMEIIPYIIPGRTGAQMLPEDLAILAGEYANVKTVKEATADIETMRKTRKCCGNDYSILSGDDGMTFQMMTDPDIKASGVISVVSNIAPFAVAQMVKLLQVGDTAEAENLQNALDPLFGLVTVKTNEQTPYGEVSCRARNPLPIKTLMMVLGMPSGYCRKPLGKMTKKGFETVIETAKKVQAENPDILKPVAEFFKIDIEERLNNPSYHEGLYYSQY
jgi:4-hydroxy-tetrahydrodipicolinate synthase